MNLLTQVLNEPERLLSLSSSQWDDLLRFSRHARMMATLDRLVTASGCTHVPNDARILLDGARVRAEFMQMQANYELDLIASSFTGVDVPLILLKGVAYLHGGLPAAEGRLLSDIDLLVPQNKLPMVEACFHRHGWQQSEELNEYDEHYYRAWSHEIPPLKHPVRAVELDVHHNIIQPTSRIKVDAEKLITRSVPVPNSRFRILCPEDLVLHSASHLLFSDELRGGLRDLWDMNVLCQYFSQQNSDFYTGLADRALELGVEKPVYYALNALQHIFALSIPADVNARLCRCASPAPIDCLMKRLIHNTLVPDNVEKLGPSFSQQLLYIRAHWVRMPPFMLAKHLWIKWNYRRKTVGD